MAEAVDLGVVVAMERPNELVGADRMPPAPISDDRFEPALKEGAWVFAPEVFAGFANECHPAAALSDLRAPDSGAAA